MNRLSIVALLVLAAPAASQLPVYTAYHGVSLATQQAQTTALLAAGYRPISISVAGGRANQHYSAVWIQRPGPSVLVAVDMTQSQATNWVHGIASFGFWPRHVSVSGDGTDVVCAVIAEFDPNRSGYVLFGLHEQLLEIESLIARDRGKRMAGLAIYGTASAPKYAVVFEEDPDAIGWNYEVRQSTFAVDAKRSALLEGDVRPALVVPTEARTFGVVWHDDRIPGGSALRTDLTSAGLQTELTNWSGSGYMPLYIRGAGFGAAARYAVLFVQSDLRLARSFTRTGAAVPELAAIDFQIEAFMRENGIRAGSVAITVDGRLVFARGYTWAESGYPITQPSSRFRIASLTKPLTAIALHDLANTGSLAMTDTISSYLNLSPLDTRYDAISIEHAIMHISGFPRGIDPWVVAGWLNPATPTLPVAPIAGSLWCAATQVLPFDPGSKYYYSNNAYRALGGVIEQYATAPYLSVLQSRVASPLGIPPGRFALGGSRSNDLAPDEVRYDAAEPAVRESHVENTGLVRPLQAIQYSGDVAGLGASGGLIASTVDYVRVLSGVFHLGHDNPVTTRDVSELMNQTVSLPQWLMTGDVTISRAGFSKDRFSPLASTYYKGGLVNGVATQALYRTDGIAMAWFFNKTDTTIGIGAMNQLVDGIAQWPTHDLWPSVGLPTFPRSPEIIAVQGAVENVGDDAFIVTGNRLDSVVAVQFGSRGIVNQSIDTWSDGYFELVDSNTIHIHPPQGLAPGAYPITVTDSQQRSSNSMEARIVAANSPVLRAPPSPSGAFSAFVAAPGFPPGTVVLPALSRVPQPSDFPGFLSMGIGNDFQTMLFWPRTFPVDPVTGVATWTVPPMPPGVAVYFQAVIHDPASPNPLPFPVTDVDFVVRP